MNSSKFDIDTNNIRIRASHINKDFYIYERPAHRLKQFLLPRIQGLFGFEKRGYCKKFSALSDVSFSIRRGQAVGIIGRNGSGKSTLLQIISGTLSPTTGEVEINGRVAALLELGSGFNPEFSGRENIYMNGKIYGLSENEITNKYDGIVAFADIGDFIEQPVKTYSSGMTLRLAFAVMVHVDADILIIDEALAVGDVFFTQKCMRFLHNFMEKGTLLFVSHDMSAIRTLCDYAIFIDRGRIVSQGSPKEITEQYLEDMFAARQGEHAQLIERSTDRKTPTAKVDQRCEIINASPLRNDIQIFEFDESSRSFGKGGAGIINVGLYNEADEPFVWCVGGETATLKIQAEANMDLQSVIVGFYIKNSLGQELFGDNTYISHLNNPVNVQKGDLLIAKFLFEMPRLPTGDYTISAGISTGTQADHILQVWVHDAMALRSCSSSVASGLLGIPMGNIELLKSRKSDNNRS